VYLALYGPEGLVIFDHPYNADYERLVLGPTTQVITRRLSIMDAPPLQVIACTGL
jgi:hypothetical protein